MNDRKVIQNLEVVDYLLVSIPLILLFLTFLINSIWQKMSGGGGVLGGLPLFIMIIFGGSFFLILALVSALLLRSKLIFRIIIAVAALPLLYVSFSSLIDLIRVWTFYQ